MSKLNNEQFSLLIESLKNIEERFITIEKQFEISKLKFETIEKKLDKQDKSKWINNLVEPFSFTFIYRSISFYFSKNIIADSIKDLSYYLNKEKKSFEISKLLTTWIFIVIFRVLYNFYQKNKENKLFIFKSLIKSNYK